MLDRSERQAVLSYILCFDFDYPHSQDAVNVVSLIHLHLRTKSQKKRFEKELNERIIRTFDGINAQK